jgi:hypothetical protein
MHLDYVNAWVKWAHSQGSIARNQAHGAPGNLLDLYAAADIPETESYGMTPLPISGFRAAPEDINPDPDPSQNLIARFASSAAHVAGKPLASSETLTWLRENFRETPWAAKPQLDRLFAAGINHIFYHGASYTPADAPWPGWLFYASTQFNPNNPLWQDYSAMNAYVARVQSVLQAGRPDNDVLLYWSFDDIADDPEGLMRQLGVHENKWLTESATARIALQLLAAGVSFDFISEAQIAQLRVQEGRLVAPGGHYRALVIPRVRRMSPSLLANLSQLTGLVLFEALPEDVPGFGNIESRRAEFTRLLADPSWAARVAAPDVPTALQKLGVPSERAGRVFNYIRRRRDDGKDYFFVNHGAADFNGWMRLGTPARSVLIMDPLSGRTGFAAVREGRSGTTDVFLQLARGESLLLHTSYKKISSKLHPWQYVDPAGRDHVLTGPWQVEFLRGGPTLPGPLRMDELRSWADLPGLQAFSGTARYRIEFDAPSSRAAAWLLDLGDVREAARVVINGEEVGRAWSLPFQLRLPGGLKPRGNVLEIEVTNLPANRIRDLDLRKVDWKVMKEINLVNLRYKPFDASGWPVAPSGLLGPVRLQALAVVRPR